jgi:hypothetical protein
MGMVPDIRVTGADGAIDPVALQRSLAQLRAATNQAAGNVVANGNRLEEVAFTNGGLVRVPHKLGRKPLGWFVTRTRLLGLEAYDSGNQTITSSGALSLTHGLGGTPLQVAPLLVCTTNEDGYVAGDEIWIASQHNTAERGASFVSTSTTIAVQYGTAATVFEAQSMATGSMASLSNANFALVVRAYRPRRIIDQQANETLPESFLRLYGTGFVTGETCDLWVF